MLGLWRRLVGYFRPTVYDTALFYSVAELEQLLQLVADEGAHIVWRTTLFPRWWREPWPSMPWGGLIAMALHQP